ncbi:MAG: L,D-transpeptidase family protein [Arenimonas sp.]
MSIRLQNFLFIVMLLVFANTAFADSRAEQAEKRVKPLLVAALAEKKLNYGNPVFIRIFKAEKVLEVWIRKKDQYVLFHTYPICTYSGRLGPKTREGDNQAPEGFYRVGLNQLNPQSNYHLAFNLGYPNAYDRANSRTGDFLMVHGNCVSIGCYAMGDAAIEEIYTLMDAALHAGQKNIDVHAFPFRFDSSKISWQNSEWQAFWSDLKTGFDAFNQTKKVPIITVVNKRYRIALQ